MQVFYRGVEEIEEHRYHAEISIGPSDQRSQTLILGPRIQRAVAG